MSTPVTTTPVIQSRIAALDYRLGGEDQDTGQAESGPDGPRVRTNPAVKSHIHGMDSLLIKLLTPPLASPYFLGFGGGSRRVEKVQ